MIKAADHVLVGRRNFGHLRQRLSDGRSGNRECIAVNQIVCQQDLHDLRNSAGTMKIGGYIASSRLEIAQDRDTQSDGREIIEREWHLRGVGNVPQLNHTISATAYTNYSPDA